MAFIKGDKFDNILFGTAGQDEIHAGDGDDTVFAQSGTDKITGDDGNDFIDLGFDLDFDEVFCGDGDDYVASASVNDELHGDDGIDGFDLNFFSVLTPILADMSLMTARGGYKFADGTSFEGFEYGRITFGAGDDIITAAPPSIMNLSLNGGGGDDQLLGSAEADQLTGGFGLNRAGDDSDRDILRGEGGADTLLGGVGDQLFGGDGADFAELNLIGSTTAWTIDLTNLSLGQAVVLADGTTLDGVESGTLYGGEAGDTLSTGGMEFNLYGGGGDDVLTGGALGVLFAGGAGNDIITGGAGIDTVLYGNAAAGVVVNLAKTTAQNTVGDGFDQLIGIENLEGSYIGNDRLTGDKHNNSITGWNGNDVLNGGGGADRLWGGIGEDILIGAQGADLLIGRNGADEFRFRSIKDSLPGTSDVINDLNNEDVINLSKIDADTTLAGNQAFVLVSGFTGTAGEAFMAFQSGQTVLSLDVNGDAVADSVILMTGDVASRAHFIL